MACRSVNNLRLSKDDMRRAYREQACGRNSGVKISHILKIIEILGPIIPHFFNKANEANIGNMCGMGGYAGADDKPFHGGLRMECGSNGIGSGHNGHSHAHGLAYDNASGKSNVGYMACAEDYGDRVISEEEFERLLDYAEQCNVKMY